MDPFNSAEASSELQTCKKCELPINEGHAYELGDDRWHIPCFKCSKCNTSLGCNSNFLVLGNGSLICSNCSYNCKQCNKKIDDLAILTGDQAYCSSCFKCRSCKEKIEDLRYARTSKGLFCMNCHEKLIAKKKKYDLKKQALAKQQLLQQQQQQQQQLQQQYQNYQPAAAQPPARSHSPIILDEQPLIRPPLVNQLSHGQNPVGQRITTPSPPPQSQTLNPVQFPEYASQAETSKAEFYEQQSRSTSSINKNLPPPPPQSQLSNSHTPLSVGNTGPVISRDSVLSQRTESSFTSHNSLGTQGTSQFSTPITESVSRLEPQRIPAHITSAVGTTTMTTSPPYSNSHNTTVTSISQSGKEIGENDDYNIEEINDSDDELNQQKQVQNSSSSIRERFATSANSIRSSLHSPPLSQHESLSNGIKRHGSPSIKSVTLNPSTPEMQQTRDNHSILQPAVELSAERGDPDARRRRKNSVETNASSIELQQHQLPNPKGKNILIRSPNQFHDHEFHSARSGNNEHLEIVSSGSDIKQQVVTTDESNNDSSNYKQRMNSPFAKANRQARVVETNDSISTDMGGDDSLLDDEIFAAAANINSTPKKKQQLQQPASMASPPPRVPLPSVPSVPSTPVRKDFSDNHSNSTNATVITGGNNSNKNTAETTATSITRLTDTIQDDEDEDKTADPQGLGLDIDYYDSHRDYLNSYSSPRQSSSRPDSGGKLASTTVTTNPTPAVTNLEEQIPIEHTSTPEQSGSISRKTSILRTPKLSSLKHKRSTSAGSNKFGSLFKSKDSDPIVINNIVQVATPQRSHSRHVSEGSITGSAFSTPPLPLTSPAQHTSKFSGGPGFNRDHFRSTSETGTIDVHEDLTPFARSDLEMRSIKLEVYQLDSQKQLLNGEVKRLYNERSKLNHTLKDLKDKINGDTGLYEILLKEVDELKKEKKKLLEVNNALSEENHRLEIKNASQVTVTSSHHKQGSYEYGTSTDYSGGSTALAHVPSQSSGLVAGAPYSDEPNDESPETHKATKLKFWRRPKLGVMNANGKSVGQQGSYSNTLNTGNTPMIVTNSSNGNNNNIINGNNSNNNLGYNVNGNNFNNGSMNDINNANGNSQLPTSQAYSSYAIKIPSNQQGNPNGNAGNNGSIANTNNNVTNGNNVNSTVVNGNGTEYLTTVTSSTDKKGLGGFITKSRSSNILDNFLNGSASNQSLPENVDPCPLFTSTLSKRALYEKEDFPLIITKCIEEVEKRGLDMEGIYRISGGNSAIVSIENAFTNLPPNSANDEKLMTKLEETIGGDINAVTSALKRYLRKLPEPIIPYSLYDDFIKVSSSNAPNKIEKRMKDLRSVIQRLPIANRLALQAICQHLDLVNSYCSVNRMGFKNLSVVFAPTLARDETGQKEMIDMGYRNDVTDLMFSNFQKIFT
ncbi:hypothetical protein CLIB1423_05S00936 [[Candida] railenensis]|uniref:Uncharacterized protein n=1 Tax=[Candida] railenensis TaxID=45579 RepID=A0A9P0QP17_9ASCO|nr:hypothetical protein CLIB1423_05S00936 [[Candida] railenensis]